MATTGIPQPDVVASAPPVDSTAKIAELEQQVRSVGESAATGMQAIRESLQRLEANPRLAPPQPEPVRQEEADFFTDPRRATIQTVGPAIDALARNQLDIQSHFARQSVERDPKLGRVLSKWGSEVDAIMSKEPPQQRANPVAWTYAAKSVLSDHLDEITQSASKGQQFFVEPAGGTSLGGNPPSEVKRSLTANESKAAKLFGMSPEKYLERQDEVLAGVQD